MRYLLVAAALAAVSSALSLDFQPSVNADHPAFSSDDQSTRIVGGLEVPPHQAPYQAALYFGEYFCGGSLINERYILTSAQCASLSNSAVIILGAHRFKEKEPEQMHFISRKIIIHPLWEKFFNDVALVMLPQNIRFTSAINPIDLIPPKFDIPDNQPLRITGWGITGDGENDLSPVLRYIVTPSIHNRHCEQKFHIRMFDGQRCLSGENSSPCRGDGGAPVIASFDSRLVQVGIVSFIAEDQCERGYPVGLTKVSHYYNWIMSIADNAYAV